jgi:hypothetical protein
MFYYDTVIDERVKGFQYAQQPGLVTMINETEARFVGSYVPHTLLYTSTGWKCDCDKYQLIANSDYPSPYCAHVIAVERFVARSV